MSHPGDSDYWDPVSTSIDPNLDTRPGIYRNFGHSGLTIYFQSVLMVSFATKNLNLIVETLHTIQLERNENAVLQ